MPRLKPAHSALHIRIEGIGHADPRLQIARRDEARAKSSDVRRTQTKAQTLILGNGRPAAASDNVVVLCERRLGRLCRLGRENGRGRAGLACDAGSGIETVAPLGLPCDCAASNTAESRCRT